MQENLPYSIEAEQSVLGSVLLDKSLFMYAADSLKTDDFYSEQNAHIFDAMLYLYKSGSPIDLIMLTETLKNKEVFDKVGGLIYLTHLSTAPDFKEAIEIGRASLPCTAR